MIYLVGSSLEFDGVKTLVLNEIRLAKLELDLNSFDCLILTSKNSIKSLEHNNIKPNENIEVFVIGEATYSRALKFGFKKIYTSKNSHGNEFGIEILPFLKSKKVLYLRAKKVVSNIFDFLTQNKVDIKCIIAYENISKMIDLKQKPSKNSIIIFTSPSSVDNFIMNFGWDESYKAICIGNTTANRINFTKKITISKKQTINSCIELAKTLL
ncbi:uroporphyrinogen-III synthase [Campylobacter pinnipediorum]|uniref:Uroporphyrinogen-III synthase n=1 Tax=Campylobacter pinnipediorum subsp. pinnipediorum TaxID=1660067 RepID=A0AAX0LBS5_9BACT|nr:uroporphyrinogen-III synthase [Campylobacter pinnipediorum]AQW83261.1 uroporphyrinogen III synthase [Campylobacter pinnipediorum subsp. pinnipediorum]OPA81708.1 uroporphyrinogen-III synthase [Campylobacter pinnipediorum subsp. pinnipediorum]